MWAPTAAGPFIAEHLKSLAKYPPRQKADTLSLKKALEGVMAKLENAKGGNQ
jgi:arylsulfatase